MGGDSCSASAVDQALGIVAGVLLAICLMPQLWKMYSTKSARDICACWLRTRLRVDVSCRLGVGRQLLL